MTGVETPDPTLDWLRREYDDARPLDGHPGEYVILYRQIAGVAVSRCTADAVVETYQFALGSFAALVVYETWDGTGAIDTWLRHSKLGFAHERRQPDGTVTTDVVS